MTARETRACFGSHLSASGGVSRAIDGAIELGLRSLQLFTKNASRWEQAQTHEDELARFRERRRAWGVEHPILSHDSYLINLASPDRALRGRSRRAFIDELERAERLGIDFLVTHPGAHVGSGVEKGIARVVRELRAVLAAVPAGRTRILLECTAGQGSTLGSRFRELGRMLEGIGAPERVGVCLDTCHLFAAGYELAGARGYRETMAELEGEIGSERVLALHLNDSKGERGSRLDRHEHIGRGRIGLDGFRRLLRDRRFQGKPKILETPKEDEMDRANLAVLRAL